MLSVAIVILWSSLIGPANLASVAAASKPNNLSLLMPDVQPKVADTYLCFETKLDPNKPTYITGFKPMASKAVAHHILIYGCNEPGNIGKSWNCGEMKSTKGLKKLSICKGESSIIYAWGMDAPELILPKNVAFKVGGNTHIKSLVLQVHYMDVSNFLPPKNGKDDSGVILTTTNVPQARSAGVYLLDADGSIPAKSTTYMETACAFNEPLTLHPFAYRAHAHKNGQVISGYRVRNGKWKEIGRVSPQLAQMFYPVTTPGLTVEKGDILAARCTMVNHGKKSIKIGNTVKDEMCNFYMMYYVDGDKLPKDRVCYTPGPPSWSWKTMKGIHPENAPKTVSVDPDEAGPLIDKTKNHIKVVDDMIDQQKQEMKDRFQDASGRNVYELEYKDPQWNKQKHRGLMLSDLERVGDPALQLEQIPMFDDGLKFDFPEMKPMIVPEVDEPTDFGQKLSFEDLAENFGQKSLFDDSQKPYNKERISLFDDKEKGGKGYELSSDVYKQLNIPNGQGFYKESRKQSGYSWNSADAIPAGNIESDREE